MERICQSCGMPMMAEEHFGTNNDKTYSEEFCTYCYQHGKFTDSFMLEDMIASNLQYPDSRQSPEGYLLSEEEAALQTRLQLITLKRWKVLPGTQEEYFRAVGKAVHYIRTHLQEPIELTTLGDVAAISRFHFHRIFKAVMNENPGEYIQRVRLENAAFKLLTTRLTLSEIAFQTGYQTQQSLSRSFKKYYGMNPSVYRATPSDISTPIRQEECRLVIEPEIRKIPALDVFCLKAGNPYTTKTAFTTAWKKLLTATGVNGIPDKKTSYYCVSWDVPTITHPDRQNIYVCIHTQQTIRITGRVEKQQIREGLYAVFPVSGNHKQLSDVYCYIYRHWLPNSKYEVRDCSKFEKFLTNPSRVEEKDIRTEIYIPIQKRK